MKTIPPEFICPICGFWNCRYKYCAGCDYLGLEICSDGEDNNCTCDDSQYFEKAQQVAHLKIQLIQKEWEIYYLNTQLKRWRDAVLPPIMQPLKRRKVKA